MRCLYCDKIINKISLYSFLIEEDSLCVDCRSKLNKKRVIVDVMGLKIESFYQYDSLFKSILIQYKEAYDEALKDVLLYGIADYINLRYFDYHILFAPSSNRKLQERGFNHLELMFDKVRLKKIDGLYMKQEAVQQGKSHEDRKKMLNNYVYDGQYHKKILIVDDVVTTGSTMRGIYDAVRKKVGQIKLLSMAYKYLQID